jgi:hypothetical protein
LQTQEQVELATPEPSLEPRRGKLVARETQAILETRQFLVLAARVVLAADWLSFSLKQLLVLGL